MNSIILTSILLAIFYLVVRPIKQGWIRGVIASVVSLTYIGYSSHDLPLNYMDSMMASCLPWLISIRLVHTMTLPSHYLSSLSPFTYAKQFLWIVLPIVRNEETPRPLSSILFEDTLPQLAIAFAKIIASKWMHEWILQCLEKTEGGGMDLEYSRLIIYTLMYAFYLLTTDYLNNNLLPAVCSLVTLDRFYFYPFNNWAVLAHSPRVFWGQRYNKLVYKILKESVFFPLQLAGFSTHLAAFSSFTVSGLLHAHVAQVVFGHGALKAFMFFILHGILCALDANLRWTRTWPRPIGWALFICFLSLTLPLYLGLFVQASPTWLINNPLLVDPPTFLNLPVPSVCF